MSLLWYWDKQIFFWINQRLHHPLWDSLLPWLEPEHYFLIPIFLLFGVFVIFGDNKLRRYVVLALIALSLTQATVVVGKHTIQRTRPLYAFPKGEVRVILPPSQRPKKSEFSFPSGHTAFFFALATFTTLYFPKVWVGFPLWVLACLVGFSRIYLGVHYPSDVFAGMVVGILVALFIFWAEKRLRVQRSSPSS